MLSLPFNLRARSLLSSNAQQRLARRFAHIEFEDCYPYHWFDLPGREPTVGSWDLRAGWHEYLGNVDFVGMRVLEVGPASGYLTWKLSSVGADVVVFDLPPGMPPDLLPNPSQDLEAARAAQVTAIDRVRNSWWHFRGLAGWRAAAVYGDIYDMPAIGRFDAAFLGAVLLHLADPFAALCQVASAVDNMIVVTDLFRPEMGERSYMEFSPHPELNNPMCWWYLSPTAVARMLWALGFIHTNITFHSHAHHPQLRPDERQEIPFFTVVARR